MRAGAGACLQPGSALANARGPRKQDARQDIWDCDLVVTVTFYLTGGIIISFIILIVIFKCA